MGGPGPWGTLKVVGRERALCKISQTLRAEKGEGRGQEEASSSSGMRRNVEANPEGSDCRVPVSQLIYHGPSRNEGSPELAL